MKVPYIQKYFVEHTKWIYAWLLLQLFLLTAKGWILDINDQWGKKLYWNLFCVLRYSIYLKITHEQWVMWHLTALQISFCVLICTLANEQLHFQDITMINDTGWWHASDPIFFKNICIVASQITTGYLHKLTCLITPRQSLWHSVMWKKKAPQDFMQRKTKNIPWFSRL